MSPRKRRAGDINDDMNTGMDDDDGNDDDIQQQQPRLNLSRLGRRAKAPPLLSQNQKSSKPKSGGSTAAAAAADSTSASQSSQSSRRTSFSIPIPSSFVDSTFLGYDATRVKRTSLSSSSSSGSSSSSDDSDDDLSAERRQIQKLAAKEAIRQKLNLCKRALLSGTTVTVTGKAATETLEICNTGARSIALKENIVEQRGETAKQNGLRQKNDGNEAIPSKRHKVNSMAPATTNVDLTESNDTDHSDAQVVLPSSLPIRQPDTLLQNPPHPHPHPHLQMPLQPNPHALRCLVDEVFGTTVESTSNGLESCTLKQFLVAIQAKVSVPFSKETKIAVKERVTFLVQEHVRRDRQKSRGLVTSGPGTATANAPMASVAETRTTGIPKRSTLPLNETHASIQTLDNDNVETTLQDVVPVVQPKGRRAPKARPTAVATTNADQVPLAFNSSSSTLHSGPTQHAPMSTKVTSRRVVAPKEKPKGPAAARKTRATGANANGTCNLCSKCPCHYKSKDAAAGTTSLDLAQSDPAIEKALMNRLLKLEVLSDQYDEQTDAVRRRLKKHRREMWQKRQALLQACRDLEASRKEGSTIALTSTSNATSSRFLPDVDESHQDHNGATNRWNKAIVAKARSSVYSGRVTAQATLTQMMGSRNKEHDSTIDNSTVVDDNTATSDQPDNANHGDPTELALFDDDNDGTSQDSQHLEIDHVHQPCMGGTSSNETDEPALLGRKTAPRDGTSTSVWEAVRLNKFDSSFDTLFVETTVEDLGVDHLLGLLDVDDEASCQEPDDGTDNTVAVPASSQSSISTRGQSLATALTERINADTAKLADLTVACPNWKENITFAMRQKDQAQVAAALQQVHDRQGALQRAKGVFRRHVERQEAALSVFAESLELSMSRFDPMEETDGFFFSQYQSPSGDAQSAVRAPVPVLQPVLHAKQRRSVETEVGTILASALSPQSATSTPRSSALDDRPPRHAYITTTVHGSLLPETPLSLHSDKATSPLEF